MYRTSDGIGKHFDDKPVVRPIIGEDPIINKICLVNKSFLDLS